jgi:hypothetical protein
MTCALIQLALLALSPVAPGLAPTPTAAAAQPEVLAVTGGLFRDSSPLEQVTLETTRYGGDCPGESDTRLHQVELRSSAPPCPQCRVRITNERTGGYSDRDYTPSRIGSQDFIIGLGSRHHQQFLSLQEGSNPFRFAIRQNDTVIVEGAFTLEVAVQRREVGRSYVSKMQDTFCDNEQFKSLSGRTPLSECRYAIVTQVRGVCPNGQETVIWENRQPVWRRR